MLAEVWRSPIVCEGVGTSQCGYPQLIELVQVLIQDLVVLSTLICVAAFIYAGFQLLMSQGNPSALTKVKTMMGKIFRGYVFILAAWLIVYTITSALLVSQDYNLLGAPR